MDLFFVFTVSDYPLTMQTEEVVPTDPRLLRSDIGLDVCVISLSLPAFKVSLPLGVFANAFLILTFCRLMTIYLIQSFPALSSFRAYRLA